MFRKISGKSIITAVILISILSLMYHRGSICLTAEASKFKTTEHLHFTENITAGQIFKKTYTIKASSAGIISSKIRAKNLGCNLRITIYGNNPRYISANTEIPELTMIPNQSGNATGSLKTNHIVMADTYRLSIQGLMPAKTEGKITSDLYFKSSSLDDNTYIDIAANDSPKTAQAWKNMDHRYHTFMLSGYREQEDYTDFYRIHIKKKMYLSLRTKTVLNTENTNYYLRLIRENDNTTIANFDTPGKSPSASLIYLTPGNYYLQVSASNSQLLQNRQILYAIYTGKSTNITSIKLSRKRSTLYQLKGYHTTRLLSKLNGKRASKYDIAFKSSNPSVAAVSQSGKVTAKASGKATITCYAIDKPSVKATCKVTVKKPSLKVSVASRKIFIGNSTRCSAKRSPKKLKVTWKSSHPSVATINAKGKVTGKSVGKTKIYAISREGIKSNACTITVHRKPKPKPKKLGDTTTEPGNKDDRTDKIAPVLSLSSAHLSPKGTITVTANVSGGTFSARGAISIKTKFGKSCVIRATAARGSGTILYQVNGKSASKSIVIY